MAIELVKAMVQNPGTCMACGGSPCDESGKQKPAIDLGVDINWGEGAYVCEDCVHLIVKFFGYEDLDTITKTREENERLRKENTDLSKKLEEQEVVLAKIREGSKAVRKVKAA